ncbi:hypothetical protein [Chryseobacterium sp. IHB B 17019]|nr:hypothetical protein [Chryseobacterium sp. IHB B 17019]
MINSLKLEFFCYHCLSYYCGSASHIRKRTGKTETNGIDFYQNNYMKDYYKSFGFNVTYKFGKLKYEIKSTRRKIQNNDLAN